MEINGMEIDIVVQNIENGKMRDWSQTVKDSHPFYRSFLMQENILANPSKSQDG